MTHKDIYTKFMIEYDKANVTSSYPSLTEYEVATLLDKAYSALIAQKVTGNNPRRSPFESDVKAVADVQPLIKHLELTTYDNGHFPATNVTQFDLPKDWLYNVQTLLNYNIIRKVTEEEKTDDNHVPEWVVFEPGDDDFENIETQNSWLQWSESYHEENSDDFVNYSDIYGDDNDVEDIKESVKTWESSVGPMNIKGNPYDGNKYRYLPCKLVTHEIAEKFLCTPYNMPWVKIPVCFIEDNVEYIVYDPLNIPNVDGGPVHFIYIRKPIGFIKDSSTVDFTSETSFELSDTMAEELINLAIAFALESTESPRLNTKLNTRGLEA